MRLIDADALRQHIVDMVLNTYVTKADDDLVYVANILVAGMLAQIEQQPTVDAIPIEWISSYIQEYPYMTASSMLHYWSIDQALERKGEEKNEL